MTLPTTMGHDKAETACVDQLFGRDAVRLSCHRYSNTYEAPALRSAFNPIQD